MKSFHQFINEVQTTTRQGIVHFEKMKDVDFVRFIQKVDQELDGRLEDLHVELKIDGLGARFGKDESGRIFFEGSRTGPQFEPKAFSTFAKSKGKEGELLTRARHYDDILDIFKQADFMDAVPNDTKVITEILYNPLARREEGGLVFVKISYDESKLGDLMTLMPHDVQVASTGEVHPQERQILDALQQYDSSRIKIMEPKLKIAKGGIDIRGVIDPIRTLDDEAIRILQSRKKADQHEKANLRAIIQRVKDDLSDYLLNNDKIQDKDMIGQEKEGLVFNIGGQQYKIQSPEFQAKMQK